MKNSLIIKSADANFEHLYKQMVKRKIALAITSSFQANKLSSDPSTPKSGFFTPLFIKGRRPPARDGHSAIFFEGNLVIFGGDRHHMPYNDLFIFDVATEFTIRKMLF